MTFKHLLFQILAFVLLAINIYLVFNLNNYRKMIEKSDEFIETQQKNINTQQEIIDQKDSIEFQELINMYKIVRIDSVLISNKSKNQPLFVFRFFRNSCHSCVDSLLLQIKKLPNIVKNNTLVISNDLNANDLRLRLHNANLHQVKYAVNQRLSFNFDSTEFPYFFIVDDKMLINMFFIPDVKNKKRNLKYFNYIIKHELFQNDFEL
jgi:hypothetical protein